MFNKNKKKLTAEERKEKWNKKYTGFKRKSKKTAKDYLKKPLTRKQKKTLVGVLLFIIVATVLGVVIGKPLTQFLTDPTEFQAFAKQQPIPAAIAFVFIMMLQIVIAVIPGEPVQLAAGYAFGPIWGTVLALAGSAVGSAVVFLLVKRYGRVVVDIFFSQEKLDKIDFIHDSKRLNLLVFILMFIPGTPKDLITYVVGLTPMSLLTWLLISIPARTPALMASTVAGASFGSGNTKLMIILISVTGVLALVGIAYYAFLTKQARENKQMERMVQHYKQIKAEKDRDRAAAEAASNVDAVPEADKPAALPEDTAPQAEKNPHLSEAASANSNEPSSDEDSTTKQ